MQEIKNSIDYEKCILQPIIDCIITHREMLSQKENAPLLAKMAYILRTSLWVGKTCFSSYGIVDKDSDFIICSPYEYVSDGIPTFDKNFIDILLDAYVASKQRKIDNLRETCLREYLEVVACKKEYSKREKLKIKPQKIFSDWIELMSNKFSLSVIKWYILFGRGNGFMYENGCIEYDYNYPLYGEWQNTQLPKSMAELIGEILNSKEFMKLLAMSEIYCEYETKSRDTYKYIAIDNAEKTLEMLNFDCGVKQYPIKLGFLSDNEFVCQFNKETHVSYIDAALQTYREVFEENKGGFRHEQYIDRHKAQYERLLELRKGIKTDTDIFKQTIESGGYLGKDTHISVKDFADMPLELLESNFRNLLIERDTAGEIVTNNKTVKAFLKDKQEICELMNKRDCAKTIEKCVALIDSLKNTNLERKFRYDNALFVAAKALASRYYFNTLKEISELSKA